LLGDLAQSIRSRTDLHFCLYYSLLEWFNPYYEQDMANNWTTQFLPTLKSIPALKEAVIKYEPEVIWSDGEWEAPSDYWGAVDFLAWLYNDSPVKEVVVTNDRWGAETRGVHGGFYNFDDRYNPGVLIPHKWENAMSLDKREWTHRREAVIDDYLTPEELIKEIVVTVSCGGNILINVGPTKEGTIQIIQQERLLQMGEWLGVNGDAIYSTEPWDHQNDTQTSSVWYTKSKTSPTIYAMTTEWPLDSNLLLGAIPGNIGTRVQMFGHGQDLQWITTPEGMLVTLPSMDMVNSKWAWALIINLPL